MDRRKFMGRAGCGLAGLVAGAGALSPAEKSQAAKAPAALPPLPRHYRIDIEIFEARRDTWCHKKGDKFLYPADIGAICPFLLSSMHDFLVALANGAVFPWTYEGTPYEKVIDPDGVTTEFVRCPDPTANLVAKITRTAIKL